MRASWGIPDMVEVYLDPAPDYDLAAVVTRPQSVRRIVVAAALIAGPVLIALAFFRAKAPGQHPGVYVELSSTSEPRTFEVAGVLADPVASAADVSRAALAMPAGRFESFFVLDPDAVAAKSSAKVVLLMVDAADPSVRVEPVDVPSVTTPVNAHAYRVVPDAAQLKQLTPEYYRRALRQVASSRVSLDMVMAVVVTDAAGHHTMHGVRIGGGQ